MMLNDSSQGFRSKCKENVKAYASLKEEQRKLILQREADRKGEIAIAAVKSRHTAIDNKFGQENEGHSEQSFNNF